jgi:glycosyltransferase involved in cell wall biosynthesis
MLEPWALNHKQIKKRIAWMLYQKRDLQQAHCHIATGEVEARNLKSLKLGIPIATIPNGVDMPEELPCKARIKLGTAVRKGQKTALFLGRIYPVKGLPMLVEAWSRVRPDGWILRIAGPDEAGHRKEVERAVSSAGLSDTVIFTGPIDPHMKKDVFFDADLFVLPSHSESFGMAVAEALAHGVPVLTTTGTPWSILKEKGCGWWMGATVDGLTEGLRQATKLNTEVLQAMGMKGRVLVAAEFGWKHIADVMLSTYAKVLAQSSDRTVSGIPQPVSVSNREI